MNIIGITSFFNNLHSFQCFISFSNRQSMDIINLNDDLDLDSADEELLAEFYNNNNLLR